LENILRNKEYLTAQEILYLSLNLPPYQDQDKIEETDGHCAMCGQPLNGKGVTVKNAVSNNFTNYNSFKIPDSNYFCLPCSFAFKGKMPDGKPIKGKSLMANPYKYIYLNDNQSTYEAMLSPLEPPFILISGRHNGAYQKHLLFRVPVNYDTGHGIFVQYGEDSIYLPNELIDIFTILHELAEKGLYISKKALVESAPDYFYKNLVRKLKSFTNQKEYPGLLDNIEKYKNSRALEFIINHTDYTFVEKKAVKKRKNNKKKGEKK
jgi:hypothetical protein